MRRFGLLLLPVLLSPAAGCRCGERRNQRRPPPTPAIPPQTAAPARSTPPAPVEAKTRAPAARPHRRPVPPARTAPEPSPPPNAVAAAPSHGRAAPHLAGLRRRGAWLDIDVQRMDVRALLQGIATATDTNLVLFGDVTGRVTVQMNHVARAAALEAVGRALGLRVTRSGAMVLIRGPDGSR